MTNLEMLFYGVKEIAKNHGFQSSIDDWKQEGEVCIWGGNNIPTICDCQLLLEDIGLSNDFMETNEWGIDIYIDNVWFTEKANKQYEKKFGGEMWKRVC